MSTSGPSGTVTPSSTSIADSTPASSWADDGDQSNGDHVSPKRSVEARPETSPDEPTHDDPTPDINGTSELASTDENITVTAALSEKADIADSNGEEPQGQEPATVNGSGDTQTEGSTTQNGDEKEPSEEQQPPKPAFQEAKLPAVNIWEQRRQAMAAKAPAPKPVNQTDTPSTNGTNTATAARRTSERPTDKFGDRSKADSRKFRNSWAGPPLDTPVSYTHLTLPTKRIV